MRRRRHRRHTAVDARWRSAPDHQCGRTRPRVRPGLHPGGRPQIAGGARPGQLHCLRQQELGHGFTEGVIAVSTGTVVTLSEYLATSYRPDCEYLDGELLERNVANGIIAACRCC